MTNWTKVQNTNSLSGRAKRTGFAVIRGRTGRKSAALIIPAGFAAGEKADIYSDGNGKIAFAMSDKGAWKVSKQSGTTYRVSIPPNIADRIPYGTTDVEMTPDGDMWVLDLNTLPQS